MRIVIPYATRRFVDLTRLGGSRVVLSPYDLESLVIEGLKVQPRITLTSQVGFSESTEAEDMCEEPVYVSRDLIECSAIAGFSHLERGVAAVRDVRGYRVVTRDEVFVGKTLVSEAKPGALIVAVHDGSNTHVVLASYNDYVTCRNAYKKEPIKCSLGFKIATCVFSDGRSLVIHGGKAYEVGFPVEAVASTPRGPLLRSGEWLLYADEEDLRPLVRSGADFTGFIHELPVFREGSKLKILDSGALVDYVSVEGNATAWNLVVDDLRGFLRVVDLRCKEVLRVPKDLGVACWATKDGVLCCRGLWCGLIDVGETAVSIESSFENFHKLKIDASTLLNVRYEEKSIDCFSGCEVSDEKASALRKHEFDLILEHLLGTAEVKVASKPPQVRVLVESARLYLSEGTHVCGGPAYLEMKINELIKPERVKIYLSNVELESRGELNVCLSSYNPELNIRVLDPVASDEISLGPLNYEVVRVRRPEVLVEVQNSESLTKISITAGPGTEVVEKKICCSFECRELSDVVRDCCLPAWIEVRTKKNNFIFNHFFEVRHTPKILKCIQESFARKGELIICREGGFLTSYVSPDFPDVPPIHDVRIKILPRNTIILFKSRVVGRALIIGDSEIKALQLKPKEASVSAPLSEEYLILVDAGKHWSYKIRLSIKEILEAAAQHANLLRETLLTSTTK